MKYQIKEIKRKAEAAFQTILVIAGDKELRGIQMKTIWKLVEACIKPIITYASETWSPSTKEEAELNSILDKIIKRILITPVSTPREVLYLETKTLDIKHIKEKKLILMLNRIQRTQNELIKNVTENNSKRAWKTRTTNLMKDYTPTDISNLKPHQAKKVINAAAKYRCTSNMIENGILKSKVEFLLLNTNQYNPTTPSYLTELNRCDASTIFKARTRMFMVKKNYPSKYKNNLTCRGCGKTDETQQHVLQECPAFHNDETNKIYTDELFDDNHNTQELQGMAKKLRDIEEKINSYKKPTDM